MIGFAGRRRQTEWTETEFAAVREDVGSTSAASGGGRDAGEIPSSEGACDSFEAVGAANSPTLAEAPSSPSADISLPSDATGSARWRRGWTVLSIPVERIVPNPSQPRHQFTEDGILRLADSVRQHGILQPLSVRACGGGQYELVTGERRLRAACCVGLRQVPCLLIDTDEDTSAELAIIENIQREDLNMFEEAEAIGRLIAIHGLTQEQVAERLSCSQSAVANKLRLLRLSPPERGLILSAGLTERHARALLRLKEPEAREAALRQIIGRTLNVAAAEELVEKMLTGKADKPSPPHRKLILKDVRLFYNSIDRAVETVRRAGVPIESRRQEGDTYTEIVIRLPKKERADAGNCFT